MMKVFAFLIFVFSAGFANGGSSQHPAEAAEVSLEAAVKKFRKAEASFLSAVKLISDKEKQKNTLEAYYKRKKAWKALSDSDAYLRISASPLPDTSTTSSLIPYWTEIRYLDEQTKQLREETEWIVTSWKD